MVQRYDRTGCYNLLQVLLRASPNKIGQCNICNTCNKKNITINNNNIRIGVHMYLRVGVSRNCYKRSERYNPRVCWLYPRNAIVTLCYKTLRFGLFLTICNGINQQKRRDKPAQSAKLSHHTQGKYTTFSGI